MPLARTFAKQSQLPDIACRLLAIRIAQHLRNPMHDEELIAPVRLLFQAHVRNGPADQHFLQVLRILFFSVLSSLISRLI